MNFETVTTGLAFPEGPVAMDDGSIIVVEMFAETLTRVSPDGSTNVIARTEGGPNGAALGPSGDMFVCNNGRAFTQRFVGERASPGPMDPDRYIGGRIQRVNLQSGVVTDLYTECNGLPLRAPNDLVMDNHDGFWFTDHGTRSERSADRTAIYYAKCDGSEIREAVFPVDSPNGIGLSPTGDRVYWAETHTGRVFEREIVEPGVAAKSPPADRRYCLAGLPGMQLLDSLAVDSAGNICVATIVNGGITVISPDGKRIDHVPTDDYLTTNICFGGPDLTTAYITLSSSGRLVKTTWPRPGVRLAHT